MIKAGFLKKIFCKDIFLISSYIIFVLAFSVFYIVFEWSEGMKKIDRYLESAAKTLPLLLENDFHDRALYPESIDYIEEIKNRQKFNKFAQSIGLEWVYTLVKSNGRFFFSSPTVAEEEATTQKRWYFHPYEDIPESFIRAYTDEITVYKTYKDQWGSYRSVIMPLRSPKGYKYLVCADMNVLKVRSIIVKQYMNSLIFFILFISLSSGIIFKLITDRKKIILINNELILHKNNLTDLVDKKTADIVIINEQLKHTEEQLKITIAEGGMGILQWDSEKDIIYCNESETLLKTSGIHETFPSSFKELTSEKSHTDDIEEITAFIETLENEESAYLEFRIKTNSGGWLWISFQAKKFNSELPQYKNIFFILFEIIDNRKKRELFLEKKAIQDSLTGIYNREFYIDYISSLNMNKRLNDFPLTVCYIDINGLKEVNDLFGHSEGDELLKNFCSFVNRNLRKTDVFCRLGGDEFLILCPGISNQDFRKIWFRIIETSQDFNIQMLKPYIILFSHGVIELNCDDISMPAEQIIALADEMMYVEKKLLKEKNRTIIRDING